VERIVRSKMVKKKSIEMMRESRRNRETTAECERIEETWNSR
jgi:hypothetical protein